MVCVQASEQKKAPACFPGESTVMTTFGTRRMDELQVGETVMVPAARNVTKVTDLSTTTLIRFFVL